MKILLTVVVFVLYIQISEAQIKTIGTNEYRSKYALNGAYCPNSMEDIIGPGGMDFNGGVDFNQNHAFRLEVNPFNSILYLDINFSFVGTDNPNVSVRGKRSLEIYRHLSSSESLIGFRQQTPFAPGITSWLTTSTGSISWTSDPDGGIFCEDDNQPDFTTDVGGINSIFLTFDIQGDTGGSDISDDKDCACDTRVLKIYWEDSIQVAIGPDQNRNGIQDSERIPGIPVDNFTPERDMKTVCISGHPSVLYSIQSNVHNADCLRLYGSIQPILGHRESNMIYQITTSSGNLVDWLSGNSESDFNKRQLFYIQPQKVCFSIPKQDLDNNNVLFRLRANDLKGCHKNCDLCTDYHCKLRFGSSETFALRDFRTVNGKQVKFVEAELKTQSRDSKNHFLKLPLKISY